MKYKLLPIPQKKRIALVAHDNKKQDLLEWAKWNKALLIEHELYATGMTGKLLEEVLDTTVIKLQSGPLGGDQQIGGKIAEGIVDFMISSTLMTGEYDRLVADYQPYRERQVEALVAEKLDELEDEIPEPAISGRTTLITQAES